MSMDMDEARRRYEALGPLPQNPGETTWVDRLRTWEAFQTWGASTAELLRKLRADEDPAYYEKQFRGRAPELHDLPLEMFGERLTE